MMLVTAVGHSTIKGNLEKDHMILFNDEAPLESQFRGQCASNNQLHN